jgi:hypothetical protein
MRMKSNHFSAIFLAITLPACALCLSLFPLQADEPTTSWKQTRTLPAVEAHQAAAADDKFIYAIASEKIAKYDRKTGERIAISTGEAKHLNSGFFLGGLLYCAHSNYPRLPEQSEIRVLDPATMKLTIYKDFDNFGGSLTWAIKKENDADWWCNFARYGSVNGETFLVRFDDQWKEQGRWTYPPEVLQHIGTASISGGVWLRDELIVTDHDHRVLYRLQLPVKGKVLKFIRQEKSPFTGQGIAFDPVTKGLVGIDRAKKEVLFAEEPRTK